MARSSDEAAPVISEEQTLNARGELFPVHIKTKDTRKLFQVQLCCVVAGCGNYEHGLTLHVWWCEHAGVQLSITNDPPSPLYLPCIVHPHQNHVQTRPIQEAVHEGMDVLV